MCYFYVYAEHVPYMCTVVLSNVFAAQSILACKRVNSLVPMMAAVAKSLTTWKYNKYCESPEPIFCETQPSDSN